MTVATLERPTKLMIRNNHGITINDELKTMFPAVFQTKAASKLSDEYQLIRSHQLIEVLDEKGLNLVEIRQQKSVLRDPGTQAHVLRFRPRSETSFLDKVGDTVPELVILNSHNGRNKFMAALGLFRMLCENGLIVSDVDLGMTRNKHFGAKNSMDHVAKIVPAMGSNLPRLSERIKQWRETMLNSEQQIELGNLVLKVRKMPSWANAERMLQEVRPQEAREANGQRDLWKTFNVLQENLTRSKIEHESDDGRKTSTKELSGACVNFTTNARLWDVVADFNRKLRGESKPAIGPKPLTTITKEEAAKSLLPPLNVIMAANKKASEKTKAQPSVVINMTFESKEAERRFKNAARAKVYRAKKKAEALDA